MLRLPTWIWIPCVFLADCARWTAVPSIQLAVIARPALLINGTGLQRSPAGGCSPGSGGRESYGRRGGYAPGGYPRGRPDDRYDRSPPPRRLVATVRIAWLAGLRAQGALGL